MQYLVFESNMTSMNQTILSLFIPRVFENISDERIIKTFESLGYGKIRQIDRVLKHGSHGNPYYSVYVHFKYWNNTETVGTFQERVLNPELKARVVYQDPWYWVVLENKGKRQVKDSSPAKPAQIIQDTEEDDDDEEYEEPPVESFDLVDADYAAQMERLYHQECIKVAELEKEIARLKEDISYYHVGELPP